MAKFEEKFIVINTKHLKNIPEDLSDELEEILGNLNCYLPENRYYVVNQDEPYSDVILKIILEGENKKELENENIQRQP